MEFSQHFALLVMFLVLRCEGSDFNDNKILGINDQKTDWMKDIADNKRLSAVTIPGTHLSLLESHQAWKIDSQFDAGLRYFDIQVEGSFFNTNLDAVGGLFKSKNFENIINTLERLLAKHKKETVLLRVTPQGMNKKKAVGLLKKLIKGKHIWTDVKVPTMAEARGKIVLIQSFGFNKGVHIQKTNIKGDDEFKDTKSTMNKIEKRLISATKLCETQIMLTVSSASDSKFFKKLFGSYKPVAQYVNPELRKLINKLKQEQKPSCLGVIAMDFPGTELINAVIEFNAIAGGPAPGPAGPAGEGGAPAGPAGEGGAPAGPAGEGGAAAGPAGEGGAAPPES